VSETLEVLGCIAAAAAAAAALLTGERRLRAAAMVAALGLALALVTGQGWDELEPLRERPALLAAVVLTVALGLAGLAAVLLRWPLLLPLLLVAALPFRIPIDVGGSDDANLLVPLYLVIGAGALAAAVAAMRDHGESGPDGPGRPPFAPRLLLLALSAAVGLYALQASYSSDLPFAARNLGFFLAPFAVMFCLLAEVRWTGRLLTLSLAVVLGEAVVFALIGVGQHIAGEIFWNPALEMSNDFHFYFRVNSVFWDPNVFGRFLALAIVIAVAALAWADDPRRGWALAVAVAIAFAGLLTAFSQTSFIALLFGLAVVCALRWSLRWTAVVAPLVAVITAVAVLVVGDTSDQSARQVTEGRSTLVSGGLDLARERPLYGYGSASFSREFADIEDVKQSEATSSHNEPITVAAEQGVVGLVVYAALIAAALWTLLSGMRRLAPGLGAALAGRSRGPAGRALAPARVGVAAAFGALLVHTIGYANYLTDPITWALLAVGVALAAQTGAAQQQSRPRAAAGTSRGAPRRADEPGGR
jgi:putative inorganic carbon (HCO3(-)) transporter